MKRLLLTSSFLLCFASLCVAQNAQVTWDQSGVASATQAQGFTYKLYVTPAGSTTPNAPVQLTSVLCGGTAPQVSCSTALPASASIATITGARSTLTATDPASKIESEASAPFFKPTAAPTNLKVTP